MIATRGLGLPETGTLVGFGLGSGGGVAPPEPEPEPPVGTGRGVRWPLRGRVAHDAEGACLLYVAADGEASVSHGATPDPVDLLAAARGELAPLTASAASGVSALRTSGSGHSTVEWSARRRADDDAVLLCLLALQENPT